MTLLATAFLDAFDDDSLKLLAAKLAPHIERRLRPAEGSDGWLDSRGAAEYLSLSVDALHKLTSAQTIPFEQDAAGCKCWFLRSELDDWRRSGGARAPAAASKTLPRAA